LDTLDDPIRRPIALVGYTAWIWGFVGPMRVI